MFFSCVEILSQDLQAGAEDERDYDAPEEGNLLYKLYSLQDLLLMVRSSVSLTHTRKVGSQNQVNPSHNHQLYCFTLHTSHISFLCILHNTVCASARVAQAGVPAELRRRVSQQQRSLSALDRGGAALQHCVIHG